MHDWFKDNLKISTTLNRITELKKDKELRLTILDINTMKFVTIIYQAK